MDPQIWIVVAIGVVLMIGWTLGGWWIVRMGFTRDRDAVGHPHADADAPERTAPVRAHADDDPNAIWRAQMKAATLASGARCDCPGANGAQVTTASVTGAGGQSGVSDQPDAGLEPDPGCPVHRWDFA